MTTIIQPPTTDRPGKRRLGVIPALAIGVPILVAALAYRAHQHQTPADDDAQHAVANTASGAVVEVVASCGDDGSSTEVSISGLTDAADTHVRVAVDLDSPPDHADELADGGGAGVAIDSAGGGDVDFTHIAPGPATVRLYQGTSTTATAHVTIPNCRR